MVTKKEFLELTQGGLMFYKLILPKLMMKEGGQTGFVINPFRDCPFKTFQIYKKGQIWLFQDSVWSQDRGNVFKFGALYYKIKYKGHESEIKFAMLHDLLHLQKVEIRLSHLSNPLNISAS